MAATAITDEQFQTEVLEADQPVLIDFWAEWCSPCRKVSPIVDELSDELDGLKVVKMDIDAHPEAARNYGVMSIPTLLVFKGGEQVARIVGAKPKAALRSEIDPHL
ncbi:thioredoxin [Salsipaludibacter albus]|jgi:thioredoxin 1|uniref:thioredoxin n=1 Tax=Salsipaludibacter albus TaxID=2849650 RepID=UPI001EE44EC2|nr:thioredoxin [Salsipaludibacter albus]MBY5161239.1 thioredoxin [Salsipaludibacter albus]